MLLSWESGLILDLVLKLPLTISAKVPGSTPGHG